MLSHQHAAGLAAHFFFADLGSMAVLTFTAIRLGGQLAAAYELMAPAHIMLPSVALANGQLDA